VIDLAGHPRPMSELLDPKWQDIHRAYEGEFRGLSRVAVSFEELGGGSGSCFVKSGVE